MNKPRERQFRKEKGGESGCKLSGKGEAMHPGAMKARIDGKQYDTENAVLIAHGKYWHGHKTFLYRTPKGDHFTVTLTLWQEEKDTLKAVTQEEARKLWESLPEHEVEFKEAFPRVK